LPHDVLNDTLNAVSVNYCFAEETAHLSAASIDGVTYDYLWSTGSSAQEIDVKAEGVYDVTISANSCSTRSEWTFIDYCPTTFYVPNSFTPNGDAHNETFAVVGLNMEDFEMLIFNRWGELIYKSNNPQEAWDGTVNGKKVQQDVYVWRIYYGVNLPSGKIQNRERIGHVTVLY
jgi:gliding motility-associated-like protein